MKTIDLKELKNQLPIGLKNKEGVYFENNIFSFKSWGLEEEKNISKMKIESKSAGQFINQMLSYMLEKIGDHNFENMEEPAKLLMINQMNLVDVLYMYIYLRYDQLGNTISLNIPCGTCGKLMKGFDADMDGLDVTVREDEDADDWNYELRKKFDIDNEEVKSLKIRRTPWAALESVKQNEAMGTSELFQIMLKHSMMGKNDEVGYQQLDDIFKKIRKVDFEYLTQFLSDKNGGPSMNVEGNCKFCASPFLFALDWNYQTFFGTSSLPQH